MFFTMRAYIAGNKVILNEFRHQHLQTCGGVKNRWPMRTIPDPFLERALILQAITPCAKKRFGYARLAFCAGIVILTPFEVSTRQKVKILTHSTSNTLSGSRFNLQQSAWVLDGRTSTCSLSMYRMLHNINVCSASSFMWLQAN